MDTGEKNVKILRFAFIPVLILSGCAPNMARPEQAVTKLTVTYTDSIAVRGLKQAPEGIAVGFGGSLYLCDMQQKRVLRVDRSGQVLATYSEQNSRSTDVFTPVDVSVSGTIEIFVLDSGRARILRLDPTLTSVYVMYASDPGQRDQFGVFSGIAYDRDMGDLYITDSNEGTIIRVDMEGNTQKTGTFGSSSISLKKPAGIDVSTEGTVLIADTGLAAIAVQESFGAEFVLIGKGLLEAPLDVAALPEGFLAVADVRGIVVFDRQGTAVFTDGYDTGRKMAPRAIAYFDNLYLEN